MRHASPLRSLVIASALCASLLLTGCGGGATGLGFNLVPQEQIQQMGLEAWAQLKKETPASANAAYTGRAKRIVDRVLQGAGMNPSDWELVVFRSDELNAFALPGNKIGIYEGMMKVATEDAELATVIGHEIAHNTQSHAAERANSEAATQLGIQLAAAALGSTGNVPPDVAAGILGAGAQFGIILPYGRNQELAADRVGLLYMAKAGYDPQAAIGFWQKMAKASGGNGPPAFMSTHPNDEARIAQIQKLMPEAQAVYRSSNR
jgi:predicted Zn-dependent protease